MSLNFSNQNGLTRLLETKRKLNDDCKLDKYKAGINPRLRCHKPTTISSPAFSNWHKLWFLIKYLRNSTTIQEMWTFRLAALWKPWFWQTLMLWCCSGLFASNLALLQHVENIASAWKALPLSAGCSSSFRYFWTSCCWMQLFRASQHFRDNGSAMPLASVFFLQPVKAAPPCINKCLHVQRGRLRHQNITSKSF